MNLIQETKNAITYKNHIDMDGDYNPDYIMLINKAFNGDEEKIIADYGEKIIPHF